MYAKISVKGADQAPLYSYLTNDTRSACFFVLLSIMYLGTKPH